jgi:hypothetical protein
MIAFKWRSAMDLEVSKIKCGRRRVGSKVMRDPGVGSMKQMGKMAGREFNNRNTFVCP